MSPPDDDSPEDRPQDLPEQRSAVDSRTDRKLENRKRLEARRQRVWFEEQISSNPNFRAFCWNILKASGAFEKRWGFGPQGHPHDDATQYFDGQRDLGLRLYHSWSQLSRAGILSLLDEFHDGFVKPSRKAK